jgi:hypothetical protein
MPSVVLVVVVVWADVLMATKHSKRMTADIWLTMAAYLRGRAMVRLNTVFGLR